MDLFLIIKDWAQIKFILDFLHAPCRPRKCIKALFHVIS